MTAAPRFVYHAAMIGVTPLFIALAAGAVAPGDPMNLESLLEEMIDRSSLAQRPNPWYSCRQFSSYDRRSTTPNVPTDEGWFANTDAGNFLRIDEREGRTEAVMMDAAGPGAIVRIWSANPKGTLRIYLDDQATPAIEAPMAALLNGEALVPPPLAANRARGTNLYLPIPYAKRCVVTCDDSADLFYQINYRTYDEGTAVESFTMTALERARATLARTCETLTRRDEVPMRPLLTGSHGVLPGTSQIAYQATGPAAITSFVVRVNPDLGYETLNLNALLRGAVIVIEFDGEKTVECPLGDFFGAAPGYIGYETWPFSVRGHHVFVSRWFMPFAKSAKVTIRNEGDVQIWAWVEAETTPYQWTDQSMHFHADWRIERNMPTRPRRDWNYLEVTGEGVYVGDALFITNPVEDWWGEGDEKIFVDGETFPSHFGTGTEDYYGYAWCCPDLFASPFHGQLRCDGPGNYGHTSVARFRALDAIPFKKSIKVDMEVWHWRACNVSYAVTCYWYGKPGAKSNTPPITPEMVQTVPEAPPLPPPFTVEGAIEGESLRIVEKSGDFPAGPQALWKKGIFSGDAHLWVQATKIGEWIDLEVPIENPGRHRVMLHFTRSWDYAILQPFVNGERASEPIDTFNYQGREIDTSGGIDLGQFDLTGETFVLRFEIVGTNPSAEGSGTFFGLDCIEVK